MIIDYDEYITESSSNFYLKIKRSLEKLLPKETNIVFIKNSLDNISIELFCIDEKYNNKYMLFSIYFTSINIIFNIYYENYNRNFSTYEEYRNLTKMLKKYFISYYDSDIYDNKNIFINDFVSILRIPVLNKDAYSNFIYKLIEEDKSRIKYLKYIKQYLNEETSKKLEHLINAINFDLI